MSLSKSLAAAHRFRICHRLVATSYVSSRQPCGHRVPVAAWSAVRFNSSSSFIKDAIVPKPDITFEVPEQPVIPKEEVAAEALANKEVIDLSQFLVVTEKTPAPEVTEAIANVTATGILSPEELNLTWWCPTSEFRVFVSCCGRDRLIASRRPRLSHFGGLPHVLSVVGCDHTLHYVRPHSRVSAGRQSAT